MSGVEIVSLISVMQTCLHGYRALSSFIVGIRAMGHDVADLEVRVHEADTRLYAFGRIHNLVAQGHVDSLSPMPPYWIETINGHMIQIKRHLDDAHAIVAKYSDALPGSDSGRKLKPHPDNVADDETSAENGNGESSAQVKGKERMPTFDLKRRPTDSLSVTLAQVEFERKRGAIHSVKLSKKVAWSLKDRDKLNHAVDSLERENDSLFYLTVPQLTTLMYDAVASRLSGAELGRRVASTGARDVQGDSPSGNYKVQLERRLAEQASARNFVAALGTETYKQKIARRLDIATVPAITATEFPDRRPRHSTHYTLEDCDVLVEWKEYNPSYITREEVLSRISDATAILNAPPSFLIEPVSLPSSTAPSSSSPTSSTLLSSPGFIEDSRSNDRGARYVGILYRLPSSLQSEHHIRTLRDILTKPDFLFPGAQRLKGQEQWKPPLGARFKLALALAQTLLAIHNCGWFHKGLRPENVVFFSAAKAVTSPFLLGWDYARPARRGQKTETVLASEPDAELYLHPGLVAEEIQEEDHDGDSEDDEGGNAHATGASSHGGPAEQRSDTNESRFRIEYDQYQLGCLLLEIGGWCLLGDIRMRANRTFGGRGWHESWRDYLVVQARRLEVDMGSIYSEVVVNLLQGLNAEGHDLEFWDAVVLRLGQCNA